MRAGLWEAVAGGYRVHDYLEYQPPKVEMIALRRARGGRSEGWAAVRRAAPDR